MCIRDRIKSNLQTAVRSTLHTSLLGTAGGNVDHGSVFYRPLPRPALKLRPSCFYRTALRPKGVSVLWTGLVVVLKIEVGRAPIPRRREGGAVGEGARARPKALTG